MKAARGDSTSGRDGLMGMILFPACVVPSAERRDYGTGFVMTGIT